MTEKAVIRKGEVVKIFPTEIWIESGVCGERAVMMQHEGYEPFRYAVFNYDYRYTCNSMTMAAAVSLAESLGAKDPEVRHSPLPEMPTADELRERIALYTEALARIESHGEPKP